MLATLREHPLARVALMVADKYNRDNVGSLAAALAYFAIFTIFPLLLGVISLVGFVVNPGRFDVQQQILTLVGSPELRDLITQTLAHFAEHRVSAGVVSFVTLLFAATGIFGALTQAVREIWEVRLNPVNSGIRTAVTTMVVNRLIAFGLLLGCAALVLAAVVGSFALSLVGTFTDWLPYSSLLTLLAQLALTVLLLTLAFAVLYRVLPYPLAAWGDVWPAALIAAVLFTGLQQLAELIFSLINFASYGALGGAMTLLLWIYLCAQVVLVGVEISYAWAHIIGSRSGRPAPPRPLVSAKG